MTTSSTGGARGEEHSEQKRLQAPAQRLHPQCSPESSSPALRALDGNDQPFSGVSLCLQNTSRCAFALSYKAEKPARNIYSAEKSQVPKGSKAAFGPSASCEPPSLPKSTMMAGADGSQIGNSLASPPCFLMPFLVPDFLAL